MYDYVYHFKDDFIQANNFKISHDVDRWLELEKIIERDVYTYLGPNHILYAISAIRLSDALEASGMIDQAIDVVLNAFRYYLRHKNQRIFLTLSGIRLIRYYYKINDIDHLIFFYHKLRREEALNEHVLMSILPYMMNLDPHQYQDTIVSYITSCLKWVGKEESLPILYLNIGVFYYQINDYNQALVFMKAGIKRYETLYGEDDYLFTAYILLTRMLKGTIGEEEYYHDLQKLIQLESNIDILNQLLNFGSN